MLNVPHDYYELRDMIVFDNVGKTYTVGGQTTVALQNIHLDVRRGEIFGIIGHSGAGKSTLVRLINLLERPGCGSISVDGQRTELMRGSELRRLRRRIGMVFQHFNLLHSHTVTQNVAFPLQLTGELKRAEIDARVAELLQRVGLSDFARKYPSQLSGGQKQRVGIARALANRPAILLCDEATSALDPQTTHSVLKLLAEINQELGLTIVLITHEMDVVRRVCHRVSVLDAGQVVETGPVEEVFLHPRHAATQALVREAEHEDGTIPDYDGTGARYRLTFIGATTHQPLLGELARRFDVDYQILAGRVGTIRETSYAQLSVGLVGAGVSGAIAHLRALGVRAEALTDITAQKKVLAHAA
ncbi:methionine import ATP-binding protein MetN [Betaproteobacteria bacterium]|nr:methionine import ATP-binding protein MetN [Betaproteobacteria bacterium]